MERLLKFARLFSLAVMIDINKFRPVEETIDGMVVKLSNISHVNVLFGDDVVSDSRYHYVWVYNTDTKRLMMWEKNSGELKVDKEASSAIGFIQELDKKKMLNRFDNDTVTQLNSYFLQVEEEGSRVDLDRMNFSKEEKAINDKIRRLAEEYLADPFEKAKRVIENAKKGIKDIRIPPGENVIDWAIRMIPNPWKASEKFEQYLEDKGVVYGTYDTYIGYVIYEQVYEAMKKYLRDSSK